MILIRKCGFETSIRNFDSYSQYFYFLRSLVLVDIYYVVFKLYFLFIPYIYLANCFILLEIGLSIYASS